MIRTLNRLTIISLLAVFSTACPQKGDETDGTTDETTDETTDKGTDTGTATDEATDTGTDDPTDTASSDSGETTAEPTTGGPAGLCEAYADFLVMCGSAQAGSEAEVIAQCEEQRAANDVIYGPTCSLKSDAFTQCLIDNASCDAEACQVELDAISNCSPEAGATCNAFADAVIACERGDDTEDLAGSCQFEINAATFDGPECGAAMEALYGCFAGLSCDELTDGTGCAAEGAAIDETCTFDEGAPALPGAPEFGTHRR